MTPEASSKRSSLRLFGTLGGALLLLSASAAYCNTKKSKKLVTESELESFAQANRKEVLTWLNYAILCDYVYHTADAPTKIPAGMFPLTAGPDKIPLHAYDNETGFYVEAFAHGKYDNNGQVITDPYGNVTPGSIVVVWRGSPYPYDPESFQLVPGYPDLGRTNASDWPKARARIWESVNQCDKGERIKALALLVEEKIHAAFPDTSIPIVHTGQSQGATDAIIAAAVSKYPDVRAVAFNGLPQGGLLADYGLDTPQTQAKITSIHSGGDTLTNGPVSLIVLAVLDGFHGMRTLNNHRYKYGEYPFFFEEKAIVLPKRETFFKGHGSAGLVRSLGVLCQQAGYGEEAAQIVCGSYTKKENCLPAIKALLLELAARADAKSERALQIQPAA